MRTEKQGNPVVPTTVQCKTLLSVVLVTCSQPESTYMKREIPEQTICAF